jgi:cytochrome c oxidase subunit 2
MTRTQVLLLASSMLAPPAVAQAPRHSALQAHGEPAQRLLEISWMLYIGGAVIFVGVMVLLAIALAGPAGLRQRIGRGWIVGGGLAFPVLVLTALLVHVFGFVGGLVRERGEEAAVRLQVTG